MPITLEFTASAVTGTNDNPFTFSNMAIGTATADRYVVVAVSASSILSFSGVTIGGSAATQLGTPVANGDNICGLYGLLVPSGTTATVVATFDQQGNRAGCGVWTIKGADTSAPLDFDAGTGTTSVSLQLNAVAGGVVISGIFAESNPAFSPSGVNEDYDEVAESDAEHAGGSTTIASDDATYDVVWTASGGNGASAAAVSFQAASTGFARGWMFGI